MFKVTSFVAILSCSAVLSACQSIGHKSAHSRADHFESVCAESGPTGAEHLAMGTRYLDAGVISQAIVEFRLAQRDPNTLAPASNGLGVAYARIGRDDLAERYLRMATAVAPEDARFAANLVRLYRQGEAMRVMASADAALVKATPPASPVTNVVQTTPGRVERLSRGEVRIRTVASAASAPRTQVVASNAGEARIKPDLTKAKASVTHTAQPAYPQRVSLSKTVYPLRISLAR